LKTDIIKLSCDFKNLTAIITCERNGRENCHSLSLKECFRVDNKNNDLTDMSVSTILEINLLDAESYHIVEELKVSKQYHNIMINFMNAILYNIIIYYT
jgi:hypothetical protein